MRSLPHRPAQRRGRLVALAVLLAVLAANTGCLRRRLTVSTNVPGARVYIDDQEIGATPTATAFTHYGTRKIHVEKDRYKSVTLYHRIRPPWYQIPPLDFIAENLIPWEIRDERNVEIQLEPKVIERPEELLRRAQDLRTAPLAHR
jgi:hypothetical protein